MIWSDISPMALLFPFFLLLPVFKFLPRSIKSQINMAKKPKSTKQNGVPSTKANSSQSKTPSVDWPLNLVSFQVNPYQQVETVIEDQIYTLPKFFSAKLCNELIRWFETASNLKPDTPKNKQVLDFVTTQMPPKKDYAARVNDRAVVYDKLLAYKLWQQLRIPLLSLPTPITTNGYETYGDDYNDNDNLDDDSLRLRKIFQDCIGLNDNFRIYRYVPGHYFGQHYDESVKASVVKLDDSGKPSKPIEGNTLWTLLTYLTGEPEGEVTGGATTFYPDETAGETDAVRVQLQKGTLLLHKHGDDCYLHEGELVKSGVKWVFRSDLVFPL